MLRCKPYDGTLGEISYKSGNTLRFWPRGTSACDNGNALAAYGTVLCTEVIGPCGVCMHCQRCGAHNQIGNSYCEHCGSRLALLCRICGHPNSLSAQFCGACGAVLERNGEAEANRPRRSFGGERKQATVLFADIVESTRLIAGLDPEEAMERLRPAVAAMVAAVQRFDGTVVRAPGDGVMALFGAPRAQEGHALLACKAALAMQEAVSSLGAARIRVGLHSGEVVSGRLDIDPAATQDAQGATVHLASRMEQMAEPGSICLSAECWSMVAAYCDVRPLGQQKVKGFAQPVEVYSLTGLRPAIASESFRAASLARFRGRVEEIALLQDALASTERGDARVIGISAAPGIGKSRLCYEFAEWCRARQVPVLETRALTYGHATPFQPILELFRAFYRIVPTDDAATARRRLSRRLLALDPGFEPDLPMLFDFLGVPDPERPPPRVDPRARHARLLDLVRRTVKLAGTTPSVLLIEDLHWFDEASLDFVETLVDAVLGTHVMLVLNFRPSYDSARIRRPYYREMALTELGAAEIRALVRELAGDDAALSETCERIADRSGGNPFFAEELIRSLAQTGAFAGEPGAYRAGVASGQEDLPVSLQAVIGARIDRLGEREKALLQIGATIGKEFSRAVLERVAELEAEEADAVLARLCDAALLREQAAIGGAGFAFRHPLIQEVAYAMQLKARRTALHAAVAKAIEQFDWGRRDELAGLLAHHYEAAGQPIEAGGHLQRAAMWVGKTNSAEALKHWKKLRWLLREQPRSAAVDRLRALACGQILNFGWREGMAAEEAKPFADEALEWTRQVGDRMHEPLLIGAYGRILAASGAADDYASLVNQALPLMSGATDAANRATLNGMLCQAYCFAGRLGEALAANDAALAEIGGDSDFEGQIVLGLNLRQVMGFDVVYWIKCLRARIFVLMGRFAEAQDWIDRMLRPEAGDVDAVVRFIPHFASVEMAWYRGDSEAAARHAAQVFKLAEQAAMPYLRVCAGHCAGMAKSAAGDFLGAAHAFDEALNLARHAKAGLEFEAKILADLADALYRAGEVERAAAAAAEAGYIARRRTARLAECHAAIIRAAALIRTGDATRRDEARGLFSRAATLIRESGASVFEPLLAAERSRLPGGFG